MTDNLLAKVEEGNRCCMVSTGENQPMEKCDVCPYNDVSIYVHECRSVLCRDTLDVIAQLRKKAAG